ncbi:MAG TPA: hypothetical protein ENK82_05405 [Campylobacterales bacterium]|nr:hypothetical protein [Campylobacterales bacterium]HHS92763.1 hypothetical protein [Campylobacterales bacterium]
MKTSLMTLLFVLVSLTFLSCNATKSKNLTTSTQQQATPKFPSVKRPANNTVVCHNCRATFKLSRATQKQGNGHTYIACPHCQHDYLKRN